MSGLLEQDEAFLLNTYSRLPIAIEKGNGANLIDINGNVYLDMFSGVGVNVLGYNHPSITSLIIEQAQKILHLSTHFVSPNAVNFAKKLISYTFPGKVFFTTSGAEATEAALKFAHKFNVRNSTNNKGIVTIKNSFHGRTTGATYLTRQNNVYQDYPQTETPVFEIDLNDYSGFEKIMKQHKPSAVIIEPIQGSGGIFKAEEKFLEYIYEVTREKKTLLIIDEVQSGFGRTGKLFAYQHSNITPDMMLFAKAAGGGLSLGGVIVGDEIANIINVGDHGTTFAHPPLATLLGDKVLDVLINGHLIEDSYEVSKILKNELNNVKRNIPKAILDVRCYGMMIGISINADNSFVKEIQKDLFKNGILVDVTQGNIIRLLPPLVISKQEIIHFSTVFENTLEKMFKLI